MVLDDFRCSSMISKTRKNIENMRLQRPSVNFNELPYIALKASPNNLVLDDLIWTQMIMKGFFNKRHF